MKKAGNWGLLLGMAGMAMMAAQGCSYALARKAEFSEHGAQGPSGAYLAGMFAANHTDFNTSAALLEQALEQDPESREIALRLQRLYLLTGALEKSVHLVVPGTPSKQDGNFLADGLQSLAQYVYDLRAGKGHEALADLTRTEKTGVYGLVAPPLKLWDALFVADATQPRATPVERKELGTSDDGLDVIYAYHTALMNDWLGFAPEASRDYEEAMKLANFVPYRVVKAAAGFYLRQGNEEAATRVMSGYLSGQEQRLLLTVLRNMPEEQQQVRTQRDAVAETLVTVAGLVQQSGGNVEALALVHMALYLKPTLPAGHFVLAEALAGLEKYEQAVTYYARILPTSLLYYQARMRLASALEAQGKSDDAVQLLRTLVAQYPDQYTGLLMLGDLLRQADRWLEAASFYGKAATVMDASQRPIWPVIYSQAICYERAGQWDKAEPLFMQALQLQPDQPDVLNYLGYSWLVAGKNIPQARDMIVRALKQRPRDAHIIDSLGWALYTLGQYEEALQYLDRAVELMPYDATVNDHLGDLYWRLNRRREARFQWERALQANPDDELRHQLEKKLEEGLV